MPPPGTDGLDPEVVAAVRDAALGRRLASVRRTPRSASSGSARRWSRCATAGSRRRPTTPRSASASGSSATGSIGFAATVAVDADAAAALADQAVERGPDDRAGRRPAGRARRRAGPRRRSSGRRRTGPTRRRSRWPTRWRSSATGASGCSRAGVDHVTAYVLAVGEDKHYADLSGTTARQRRVRVHPRSRPWPSTTAAASRRCGPRPAGRPRLGVPDGEGWDWDAELAELPELLAEKLRGPVGRAGPLRPRHRPDQPLAHDPRVDRPRHRARPGLGYEAAYAGTSFATLDQLGTLRYGSPLMHVTGDRTDRPRPGHGRRSTTRGSRPSPSTSSATASSSATSSTGRSPPRPASAAPTAAPSPTRRCTSPIQRMANVSLQPAGGDGPTHRGADRRRRARHLRRRRQELVDRHAALQLPVHRPALLPHRARPPRRPAPRRRLPGHDHRLLGLAGGGRRPVDLPARRRLQLRQGPARPGGPGQPRLPVAPSSAACGC